MPRGHVLPDGDRIAMLRGEADLTQWQLASESGYGLRTIGKIEDGQPTGASTLSAVATVLARRLKRPVGLGDLIRRPGEDGACCRTCQMHQRASVVQQGTKLLDLTAWRPVQGNGHAGESRVVLHDHYRFRRLADDLGPLSFYYASPGPRIEGRCLSHPDGSEWLALGDPGRAPAGEPQLNVAYRLRVRLGGEPTDGPEVRNRLEYIDAFSDERREWFHTHVVFPTEALTLVALFPEAKRCRLARGLVKQHPAEPLDDAAEQPVLLSGGRVVAWTVPAPTQGATYQVEWEW